ncbi:MAG: YggS family pyridoxal phosphate-dependent enzyme [Phycisphaerales bacterium JB054]
MTTPETTMPDTLAGRYAHTCQRVADAAAKSGRRPEDIILVAVTKNAEPEQIREVLALGHRDLGENRVQQFVQRAAMVQEYLDRLKLHPTGKPDAAAILAETAGRTLNGQSPGTIPDSVRWHMIGHLQRNKVRKVVEFCKLIHSVDSLRLAEEIQQVAVRREHPVDVLVQVNCSLEPQKYGCPIGAAIPLCEQIDTMVNVRVRGLMTMAAQTDDESQTRAAFARCRELFEEARKRGVTDSRCNILSMGMSNDFEIAIEEGANIVRVGTAIFGEHKPESDDQA